MRTRSALLILSLVVLVLLWNTSAGPQSSVAAQERDAEAAGPLRRRTALEPGAEQDCVAGLNAWRDDRFEAAVKHYQAAAAKLEKALQDTRMAPTQVTIEAGEIHDFCKDGHLLRVQGLLGDKPELLQARDDAQQTPLHLAARHGHKALATYLIEQGAAVDAVDKFGATPLLRAASRGHTQMVEFLLSKGADANAPRLSGPVQTGRPNRLNGATALHMAAYNGHTAVAEALIANGADVNAKTDAGLTPLSFAVAGSVGPRLPAVLLANGAGLTAHACAMLGAVRALDLLLAGGVNANAPDGIHGWTPLFYAIRGKQKAAVALLLSRGASPTVKDNQGHTPLEYAKSQYSLVDDAAGKILDILRKYKGGG